VQPCVPAPRGIVEEGAIRKAAECATDDRSAPEQLKLRQRSDLAEAEKQLDAAWSVLANAKGYGPEHPRTQDVVDSYIDLYRAWSKPDRLAQWQARKSTAQAPSG